MAYFPMFTDLTHETALIVGAGKVALRKVQVLREFCREVKVVSVDFCPEMEELDGYTPYRRPFCPEDLDGAALCVVATDDHAVNAEISRQCRERNIPVNVVDDAELCTFIFPSYVRKGELVGAVSSGGLSPLVTQLLRDRLAESMTEQLWEMTEFLGSIREKVKAQTSCESQRKVIYRSLLKQWQETGQIPTQENVEFFISEIDHK